MTDRVMESQETDDLWNLYRQIRGSYQTICKVLVERGVLAEMPTDLERPIKVQRAGARATP